MLHVQSVSGAVLQAITVLTAGPQIMGHLAVARCCGRDKRAGRKHADSSRSHHQEHTPHLFTVPWPELVKDLRPPRVTVSPLAGEAENVGDQTHRLPQTTNPARLLQNRGIER